MSERTSSREQLLDGERLGDVVRRARIEPRDLVGDRDYDHDPGTNVVDVYVGYLRRKLGRPDRPAPIETVRSVGYRLRAA